LLTYTQIKELNPSTPLTTELAAQCCTTGTVKRWEWASFLKKIGEKGASTVMNHTMTKKLKSIGYIFVADTMGLASVSSWPRNLPLGEMTQNYGHYAAQGHSSSPISIPIESPYATSY